MNLTLAKNSTRFAMLLGLLIVLLLAAGTTPTHSATSTLTLDGTGKTALQGPQAPLFTPSPVPTLTPTATPACGPVWRGFPHPGSGEYAELRDMDALSPNDVWSVGERTPHNGSFSAFAERWDGQAWSEVPAGPTGGDYSRFFEIDAISTNDIWAVGHVGYINGSLALETLTEHWDGASWTRIPSPNVGDRYNELDAVSAVSANDVWAVGYSYMLSEMRTRTLMLHWDGSAWTVVPSPVVGTHDNVLHAVAAVATNDVWAVGYYRDYPDGGYKTLILHWDGAQWSIVSSPNPDSQDNYLHTLEAISANDVWAAGYYRSYPSPSALIMHWNGSQWSVVPNPGNFIVNGLSALSPSYIWAVGGGPNAMRWDGSSWSLVRTLNATLSGVVATSPTEAWAGGGSTLERFNDPCNVATNTPTATATPATLTCSSFPITIPPSGMATPYPSTLEVSGRSGYITGVSVKLNTFTHEFHSDVDVLLVGPEGQGVVLMSDVGYNCLRTVNLVIQDGAPPIPPSTCPASGSTYRPTNYNDIQPPSDIYPSPAPPPYYDQNLATFNGGNPNGVWTLYVVDDFGNLSGSVSGGWCLDITTSDATPAATRTPTVTRTSTPATQPPTTTSTATGVVQCGGFLAQSTASCTLTDTYHYRFVVDARPCYIWTSGNIYLEAAPDVNGPWTIIRQFPYQYNLSPNLHNLIEGDIVETIPEQYSWYRVRIAGTVGVGHPLQGHTEPGYICGNSPLCPPSWNVMAAYPTPVSAHAGAVYGGSLYSFGGRDTYNNVTANAYRYDPAGNTWSAIASMPGTRYGASAATVGNKIYIINGLAGSVTNTSYIYDPALNSYTSGPTGLLSSYFQAAVVLNGKLYRIGGITGSGTSTNTVEIYGERYVAPLPHGLWLPMAVAYNGFIYVAGASQSGWDVKTYRYDPVNDVWEDASVADLPLARAGGATGILGGKWILAGGDIENENSAIAWDPATNTWGSLTPMLYGRTYLVGGTIGDAFYAVGGSGGSGATTDNQQYLPTGCATPTPTIIAATSTPTPTYTPPPPPTGSPTTVSGSTATATNTVVSVVTETPTSGVMGTSTPTTCPITFTDVPPDSTFYTFIRCLACRGVVSGYDDGTFRPNNDITRGQIAKIVSIATGSTEDPGPQIFQDVPPDNPFYVWINRLSNSGYMGGYPCGTVLEEPCVMPNNWPYFRTYSNATRGQVAKIVTNAAGIGGTPTGQYYADVTVDNPFYTWIMRLTDYGVMGGYPCGGEGEPCDSENRPYFRPYNNVTRGQGAKIVAGTFYPNCETP